MDNHLNTDDNTGVPSRTIIGRIKRESNPTVPGSNETLIEEADNGHPKGLLIFIGMFITSAIAVLVLIFYCIYTKIIAPRLKPPPKTTTNVNPIYDGKLALDGILPKEDSHCNRRLPALPPESGNPDENTVPKTVDIELEEINLDDDDNTEPKVVHADAQTHITNPASNYYTSIKETIM